MPGFWTRSTGPLERVRARLGIAGAPEAAEHLAANGIVPVAERVADRAWPRGPRAPAQDLVVGAEEDFGVFLVRKRLEPGPRPEVARGPLPHVADHPVAADGRHVAGIAPDRRGAERELVHVGECAIRRRVTPGEGALGAGGRIPRGRRLPLDL